MNLTALASDDASRGQLSTTRNNQLPHMNQTNRSLKNSQAGFTLVELIIVIAIAALLALFGVPYARSIIIAGKVEPTANDINKTVTAVRGNFAGQGVTPYLNLGSNSAATAVFANTARGLASALSVTDSGATATVQHPLGQTGSQVTVAATTVSVAGDAFAVTLDNVNDAACPGLATQLSRAAEVIQVNGTAVKVVGGAYNGGTAQNACSPGDTNTFVFTFQ